MKHYIIEILAECEANSPEEAQRIIIARLDANKLSSGGLQFSARLSEWQKSQDAYAAMNEQLFAPRGKDRS